MTTQNRVVAFLSKTLFYVGVVAALFLWVLIVADGAKRDFAWRDANIERWRKQNGR